MERRGGRFAGGRCLVVLEDARMRDIYERILAAGGAKVEDWSTIQRLNAEFMPNGVKLTLSLRVLSGLELRLE